MLPKSKATLRRCGEEELQTEQPEETASNKEPKDMAQKEMFPYIYP